ncbi:MAG: cell wall biogenesis protein, partial [bacterium]|nr:cell wall biogenesis protein [bacterium]
EVIVPALTHTATAHAVELTGAKAVFVDVEKKTGNIDIDQIEPAITPVTKAISVVHYPGLPVDMDKINTIARRHRLAVVEDCALALGSYYKGKHMGLWGDVGCFSFYPVKHMTTAEGGMLICKDETIARSIREKRAFGMDKHVGQRKLPGIYDIKELGFNYRLNEIQSAMGIQQLKRLPGFLKKRKENYQRLTEGLKTI